MSESHRPTAWQPCATTNVGPPFSSGMFSSLGGVVIMGGLILLTQQGHRFTLAWATAGVLTVIHGELTRCTSASRGEVPGRDVCAVKVTV